MHRFTLSAVSLTLCIAPLAAQEAPPGPAPELKKLAVFEGNWKGSGTALMAPGEESAPWTSRTTYEWAMSGHFLREDTVIEFEGMPAPIVFHGYIGWDRENERYVQAVVNNMGESQLIEMNWIDDHTVVSLFQTFREGQAGVEHSVSRFDGDKVSFQVSMLAGAGPMFTMVEGEMEKVADAEPVALEASHSLAPASVEMGRLEKIAGRYSVKGSMVPAPGAPSVAITGEEVIEPIFGGTAIAVEIHGEAAGMPGTYESWGCMTWNAADECYKMIGLDNMGMIHETKMYWVDDGTLVSIGAGLEFGMPALGRTVVQLDEDGSVKRVVAHAMHGAMDPAKVFEATYEKK